LPLVFGGKIYDALKIFMSIKLIVIFGFLITVGLLFARPASWVEIGTGFLKVGTVPVKVTPPDPNVQVAPDQVAGESTRPPLKNTENIFVTLLTEGRLPKLDWS